MPSCTSSRAVVSSGFAVVVMERLRFSARRFDERFWFDRVTAEFFAVELLGQRALDESDGLAQMLRHFGMQGMILQGEYQLADGVHRIPPDVFLHRFLANAFVVGG